MKAKFLILVTFLTLSSTFSYAQDPFIGEIKMFAGNFAPRGWAFCDGQVLAISQYSALFSLLGTTYGGDGRTTFALPDFRGRAPIHQGQGENLNNISLGQRGGAESEELRKVTVSEKLSGKTYETYTVRSGSPNLYTRDPYIGINYIIALQGIYPSRS